MPHGYGWMIVLCAMALYCQPPSPDSCRKIEDTRVRIRTVTGTATHDKYTGQSLPDNGWDYGKIDAFSMLTISTEIALTPMPVRDFILKQKVPNPFNNETSIQFVLTQAGQVWFYMVNLKVQCVQHQDNGILPPGPGFIRVNACSLPGGIYVYQIKTQACDETGKMLLIK